MGMPECVIAPRTNFHTSGCAIDSARRHVAVAPDSRLVKTMNQVKTSTQL